jgi:hypothetical protein
LSRNWSKFHKSKGKTSNQMDVVRHRLDRGARWAILVLVAVTLGARAQNCQTSGELDDATRSAIAGVGQRLFDLAARGDTATLRQNAVASLASDFSAVEATVKDHQQELATAHASVKSAFLLEAEGTAPLSHAEFYCGVFGKNGQTSGSAVFSFDNLPPGKYAVVILDAVSPQARTNFSAILQQAGAEWKLAGLHLKPAQVASHDSDWFAARAREYKTKGQLHNAWFFYLQARSLVSPVPSMSTLATDRLFDEFQSLQPADLPANGKTADLVAGATTYKLTELFPAAVGNDLDLIVKYQAADISNSNQTYQNNVAVIRAVVAKYPELRDAFAGVVARALDPSGHDFGTLLAMKDIK